MERRMVYLDKDRGRQLLDVYSGTDLYVGHKLRGPLLIEEATTTLFVGSDSLVEVDETNNFAIGLHRRAA